MCRAQPRSCLPLVRRWPQVGHTWRPRSCRITHHHYGGPTGGEGLTAAMGQGDLQDSGSIGNQNNSCGGDDHESGEGKSYNLIHKGVNTWDLDKSWDTTEKEVHSVFSTKIQTGVETWLDYGVGTSTDLGSSYQSNTDCLGHVHRVKERGANGWKLIECHDSQKKAFSCEKQRKEEKLSCIAIVRNVLFTRQAQVLGALTAV